jgi:PAS domain S-box-containing protein
MPASPSPIAAAQARIMIVEDEGLIAPDLGERLETLGYRICGMVASGSEAIARAAHERPDLVLMGIVPEGAMDGTEAARRIEDELNIPVVYITSVADDATLLRAAPTMPPGYIVKPFSNTDLNTAIRIALYRHSMENGLREQNKWLNATLHSIADAVVATDESGRIRLMNPVAERITGWTETEATGRPFRDVVCLFDPWSNEPADPVTEALAGQPSTPGARFTLCSRNFNEVDVEDSLSLIAGDRMVEGGVFVFRDITQRLRTDRAARHHQRIEAVSRVAAGFAKDIVGQVDTIRQAASSGLQASHGDGSITAQLQSISGAAERAGSLIEQMLSLGRLQPGELTRVDVNRLIIGISPLMRSALSKDVELLLRLSATKPWVMADEPQLDRVILKIFLNARDAVGVGGTIRVATMNTLMSSADGDIPAVAIRITDTGTGITPELKSRIFEPFFSTKDNVGGTGLSLASAYGVIAQSGGQIDVETGSGLGCTFIILLPASEKPEA